MPRLPKRTKNVAPYTTSQANPQAYGAPYSAAAQGAREIGAEHERQGNMFNAELRKQMARIEADAKEMEQARSAEFDALAQLELQTDVLNYVEEARSNVTGDGADHRSNVDAYVKQRINEKLKSAPNDKAALKFRAEAGAFGLRVSMAELQFQKDYRKDWYLQKYHSAVNNASNIVRNDPNSIDAAKAQISVAAESLGGMGFSPLERDTLIKNANDALDIERLVVLKNTNPDLALKEVFSNEYNDLPASQLRAITEGAVKTRQADNKKTLKGMDIENSKQALVSGTSLYDSKSKSDRASLDELYISTMGEIPKDADGNVNKEQLIETAARFLSDMPDMPKTMQVQLRTGLVSTNPDVRIPMAVLLNRLSKDANNLTKLPSNIKSEIDGANLLVSYVDAGMDVPEAIELVEKIQSDKELKASIENNASDEKKEAERVTAINEYFGADKKWYEFGGEPTDRLPQHVQDVFEMGYAQSFSKFRDEATAMEAGARAVATTFNRYEQGSEVTYKRLPAKEEFYSKYKTFLTDQQINKRFLIQQEEVANTVGEALNSTERLELGLDGYTGITKIDGELYQVSLENHNGNGSYQIVKRPIMMRHTKTGKVPVFNDAGNLITGEPVDGDYVVFDPMTPAEKEIIDEKNTDFRNRRDEFLRSARDWKNSTIEQLKNWAMPDEDKLKIKGIIEDDIEE